MGSGALAGAGDTLPGRLVYGLLALGLLVSLVVQWGLLHIWQRTLGSLFERLAGVGFGGVFGHGAIHPLSFLRKVDHSIQSQLQSGIAGSERALVYMLTKAAEPFVLLIGVAIAIALALYELAQALPSLIRHHSSTQVGHLTQRELDRLRAKEDRLEQRVGRLEHARRGVGAAAGAQDWERLSRGIDRLTREIDQVKARERNLERSRVATRTKVISRPVGRSADWTKVLTRPAAVALVATALGSLGWNFLKCNAWQRAARRITCGWGSLLEDFLGGALDVLLLRDLCQVVGVIERLAIAFEHELLALIDEIEGFICGGESAAPSAIVRADLTRVAELPSGIVAGDLQKLPARQIAA